MADWWGGLQHLPWFGGVSPDSTHKRLGVRVWGTERRSAGDVGREGIALCLGFAVEGRKVRVRVHGHPSSFQRTAQADARRLVGPDVELVGVPTYLEHLSLTRPVYDVFLIGLPDDWKGGVLDTPSDSRQQVKRWIPIRDAPRPASRYREVGKGRALPQVVPTPPPAPAPLQDVGGIGMEELSDEDDDDEGMHSDIDEGNEKHILSGGRVEEGGDGGAAWPVVWAGFPASG